MKDILILLLVHFQLVSLSQLTGTVKDKFNNCIPYATIVSKQKGGIVAIADKDGNYSVNGVHNGDTLVCSHVSYESHIECVEGNTVINFFLERKANTLYTVYLGLTGKSVNPPAYQEGEISRSNTGEERKTKVEIAPIFPGGAPGLREVLKRTVVVSPDETNKNLTGGVRIGFFVEKNGEVRDVTLIKGVGAYCDRAVMVAIAKTRWSPAEQNGVLLRSWQEVLVYF